MASEQKIGLVLAGGGGKGGYQLGVWRYLEEIGLTKKISVISGISVGGLNAVLFSLCDYEMAEWIWTTQLEGNILDRKSKKKKGRALFSRDGLQKIIDANVNLDKLSSLKRKIYVTCSYWDFLRPKPKPKSFCLNGYNKKMIIRLLCATSAIPVVFRHEKINGSNYYDGFLSDNVPLKPLIDEGCTDAIIVNLNRNYHINYSKYNIKVIKIHPTTDLGGSLDFSSECVKQRLDLGYLDSKIKFEFILKTLCGNPNEEGIINLKEFMAEIINKMDDRTVFLYALEKIVEDPCLLKKIKGKFNIPFSTYGGKLFWTNLAEYHGWRFQENKITKHVRLIDRANIRLVWGSRLQMVDNCRSLLFGCLK